MTDQFSMNVPVCRDGEPVTYRRVEGARVGPFLVHPTVGFQSGYYTVTHFNTGLSIGTYINELESAMWLAQSLVALGYDWEFSSKEEMAFTDEQKARIVTLLDSAKYDEEEEEEYEEDDDL